MYYAIRLHTVTDEFRLHLDNRTQRQPVIIGLDSFIPLQSLKI